MAVKTVCELPDRVWWLLLSTSGDISSNGNADLTVT
jgi:hypothetical protein